MGAAGKSVKRAAFATVVPRPQRRVAGRTWAPETPLAVRTSGLSLDAALREQIRRRLGLRLGKLAPHIERLTVRFEDVNGPRGGRDTACTIKVVVAGLPSIVVTELAEDAVQAFHRADDRVERAVRRAVGRAQVGHRLRGVRAPIRAASRGARAPAGKTGPPSTAARNYKGRTRRAAVALEGSLQPRPSRKTTRGGINRVKHGNKLTRRERRRVSSPNARRAQSGATHSTSSKVMPSRPSKRRRRRLR
jgi:hypothetical protein